jgi:hypothetical protein
MGKNKLLRVIVRAREDGGYRYHARPKVTT